MINKKCFAIDFDGTLVVDAYPDIGIPKLEIVNKVKQLILNRHKVILWICRTGEYLQNATSYISELEGLDKQFEEVVANGKRKEVIFADRFPLRYFVDAYDDALT